MALSDITREGVLQAISEYRAIGQRQFFDKYGFEAATKYWIVEDGQAFASKAIANVAQAIGMGMPYTHDIRLSGGENTVVKRLRELGFHVPSASPGSAGTSGGRADTWTREELILTLELYVNSAGSPPSQTSPEVADLKAVLAKLGSLRGAEMGPKFRNENGIHLKMMNFRRFDPVFLSQGKKGMERGGRREEEVWKEFYHDQPALRAAAALIRHSLGDAETFAALAAVSLEDDPGAAEGGFKYRLHKRYERDGKLAAKKKAAVLSRTGRLECEVCEFDFSATYGEMGFGYIEAHHRKPVFQMKPGEKTKLEDLALVCSNCHRMIHSRREPRGLDEVKKAIAGAT